MGGWVGGQAEYVLVPYADWNLLKFPDKDQALEKILDLTMLSDIFPTGFHGCVHGRGRVRARRSTSRAPARSASPRPHSAQLLGAAVVIVGDLNPGAARAGAQLRLRDRSTSPKGDPEDQIEQILGVPEVDAAVDAVGFEARGHGSDAEHEAPGDGAELAHGRHPGGGQLGIPGLYVTGDPGGVDEAAKIGLAVDPDRARAGRSRTASPPASAR